MVLQERFDWWAGRSMGRSAVRAVRVPAQPAPAAPAEPTVGASMPSADPVGGRSPADAAEVYRAVQASEAFAEIRRGYRGFVVPATAAFLGWYLLYVLALAAAPGLMRHRVAGPLNIAWLLGLGQFAVVFLLTWLYARNARTRRDRAALELRWDTQDQLR
ncbi:DUF485 domain-containing protein [Kitasatospora sp. NBC_01539]|uniref:DUF485 domain-containing protein n=1 Tax=Kitasatospora sp. NBC_01539 TaxID=2903577 RepID=UPI003860145F